MRDMTVSTFSTFRQAALSRSSWGFVHLICHVAAEMKLPAFLTISDEDYDTQD
jgi:hypothetical protein